MDVPVRIVKRLLAFRGQVYDCQAVVTESCVVKTSVTWRKPNESLGSAHTDTTVLADPLSIRIWSAMLDSVQTLIQCVTERSAT